MKPTWKAFVISSLAISIFAGLSGRSIAAARTEEKPSLDPAFLKFVSEKEALAKSLAEKYQVATPKAVSNFFDSVRKGDWVGTSNLFYSIERGSGRRGDPAWFPVQLWGPIHETFGTYEQFHTWHPNLLHKFGREIIESIPPGSIYLGGTDAGRFVISSLCKSHTAGQPFFTITQNALADGSYLEYVRAVYGKTITILSLQDSQKCFQEYLSDAQARLARSQLDENEEVSIVDGRVQVSGETAVMRINERMVAVLLEKNPEREFYMEESFPLKGLYSNSLPHGLILKIAHRPLERMPESIIETDREYWRGQMRSLTGETFDHGGITEVCSWAQKTYVRSNLTDFAGNRLYVKDQQAPQYYSQCRSAIASLYQWRAKQSQDKADTLMLTKEADLAHRQAVALSPFNPTVVWRYSSFLLSERRTNDAKVLIQATLDIDPVTRMDVDSETLKRSLAKIQNTAHELHVTKRN